MNKNVKLIIIALILLFSSNIYANELTSKGREFRFGFPPNDHVDLNNPTPAFALKDSIFIYIVGDKATNGNINYVDANGMVRSIPFKLQAPEFYYVFASPGILHEVKGKNYNGRVTDQTLNEVVNDISFHIVSDEDVNIFAHNQAHFSSESMLVYPVNSFGYRYFVMSYPNHVTNVQRTSFPSQFLIVASENSTTVRIMPSAPTERFGMMDQTIILNEGEVYLVQARVDNNFAKYDLTGTEISSDKPIGVIGSHQRTMIPYTSDMLLSRDYLLEMLVPKNVWAGELYLVPFFEVETITIDPDIFRVTAAYDNTILTYNENIELTVNKGQFVEFELIEAVRLKSTAPVMVCQYKKSSSAGSSGNNTLNSDPIMMYVPPKEQYLDNYKFVNINSMQYSDFRGIGWEYRKVYSSHYATVVIHKEGISSLRFDGTSPNINFVPIPFSDYVYGHIVSTEGWHTATADSTFGLYVYGYGEADSYGYLGGTGFRPVDHNPPQIGLEMACDTNYVVLTDTLNNDNYLDTILFLEERSENVIILQEPIPKNVKIHTTAIVLDNPYLDGRTYTKGFDMVGYMTETEVNIPGFTVAPLGVRSDLRTILIESTSPVKRDFCIDVRLENYGRFPQKITPNSFEFTKDYVFTLLNQDVTIEPGESYTLQVCMKAEEFGDWTAIMSIKNDCLTRPIYEFNIVSWGDTVPPLATIEDFECTGRRNVLITDISDFDYGLQNVFISGMYNCRANLNLNLPSSALVEIDVIDFNQDAIYEIKAIDSMGLETIVSDTILGKTIEIRGIDDLYEFGVRKPFQNHCDKIELFNNGIATKFIERVYLNEKRGISNVYAKLPIEIRSNESVEIEVCFTPTGNEGDEIRDLLRLEYACFVDKFEIMGITGKLELETNSVCELPIALSSSNIPSGNFISSIVPSPARDNAEVTLAVTQKCEGKLRLVNVEGAVIDLGQTKFEQAGYYQLNIELQDVVNGTYFLILESTTGEVLAEKLLINK